MNATTLMDERALRELEDVVRPQVAAVRIALSNSMFAPGRQAVADLLTKAPVENCIRIAKAWTEAQAAGVPVGLTLTRFNPEEQFLIEVITSVYVASAPASTGGTDLHELALMLDMPDQND